MPVFRAACLVATAFSLLIAPAPSGAAPARPIQAAFLPLQTFADTLAKKASPEAAHAYVDSVGRAAAARGDRALEAAATLWRGKRYGAHESEYERAAPYFERALAAARAQRDTFALALAHDRRGLAAHLTGRTKQALSDYARAVDYARRARLPEIEGSSHRGLGNLAKLSGDYERARRELGAAVRLLPESSFDHLHSRLMLGEVLNRTGHPDEARERFEEVLVEATKRRNRWTIAAALHDLGIVAFEQGDMAEADRQWTRAAAHYDTLVERRVIDRASAINARTNRAHALVVLGRLAEAEALLERLVDESALVEDPSIRLGVLGELGVLLRRAGRTDKAERMFRAVRAGMAGGEDALTEEAATIELAGLLREGGRLAAADDLLDSLLVPPRRARMTPVNVGAALMERSALRRAQGRPAEALLAAREGERSTRASASKPSIYWLDAVVELARCQRAAGRPDSAVATLARAARAWEGWRTQISNLEWRERAGSGLSGLFAEYGLALLDARRPVPEARRARQAFDALQVFQARTLEERMRGSGLAGRAMIRRVSADSLRRGVLRPGEALLDLVATPDTTFAFVVTPAGTVVRLLPGTRRLDALFGDWRDAMLAGAATPVVERGLARLSAELLAPLAGPLRDTRRLIVSGGGPVTLWPLGALTLPGEPAPLGERREVVSVPSATLFTLLRARGAGNASPARLLALSRTTDAAGRNLPGAERELSMLGRSYEQVTVRQNRGERSVPQLTADLARFDALHFAAHAEASAGTPWRSGFLLGRGTGEEAYFRASNVARLRLKARLAVLSGCQSAGATALAGEGALGLSSAFLCAGTRTVVATLWPVEDRTAELYMTAFYAALAAGRTAGGAAREAGLALRRRPETANPRSWAAFVVLGEPGTVFPLRTRGRA
jgi:CHAT domain-containing protein/tetratricopeptide (TPR) repeat protein